LIFFGSILFVKEKKGTSTSFGNWAITIAHGNHHSAKLDASTQAHSKAHGAFAAIRQGKEMNGHRCQLPGRRQLTKNQAQENQILNPNSLEFDIQNQSGQSPRIPKFFNPLIGHRTNLNPTNSLKSSLSFCRNR